MLYPGSPIKSLIIEYLGEKNFCNAKAITFVIRKYYKNKISVQAIYKNLRSLLKENILVKYDTHYTFSLNFLSKINHFSEALHNNTNKLHNLNNIIQKNKKKASILK